MVYSSSNHEPKNANHYEQSLDPSTLVAKK